MTTDGSDDLRQAIAWYEELADRSLDPSVDAHLAILYGEAGERARVEKMTAGWEARGGMLAVLAPIVNTAYLGTAETDEDAERGGLAEVLPEGWFADRLALAWATRVGDAALREEARRALDARGRQLLVRARVSRAGQRGARRSRDRGPGRGVAAPEAPGGPGRRAARRCRRRGRWGSAWPC